MAIDSPADIKAKMSVIEYNLLAWKHLIFNKHYWIDNSWLHTSPSNGFHCGRKCLFCGKKMIAVSGFGWYDEDNISKEVK